MATKKMLAPKETVWWVPDAAVASSTVGPTVAEITSDGVNISCAIVTGYSLGATDSDTDDTRSICDAGNVVNFGVGNYEVDITFFRDAVRSDNTSVYNVAFNLFKAPALGYFVKRIGKLNTQAIASGDLVSFFRVETDYTQDKDEKGVPKQFEVKGIPQGQFSVNDTAA